ncbi:MAG: HNH endonuclease [Actinobacteria bacterium]|nr:HNH endonuclease [Actinomycetota bacterium]
MTGRAPTPRTTTPPVAAPADTRGQLDEVARLLGSADRAMATVVATLTELDHAAVIAQEGQTLRSWLRTIAGCTGGDERALLLAVQRLVHLPTVQRWLADGTVSWAVVRSIVFETRRLTVAQLAWLDDTLAADADRLIRLDSDGVVSAVERLAADARPDLEADRERRQFERRYAQVQTGFDGDGSVQLYAEFDAEMGAAVLEALEATPVDSKPSTDDTDAERSDTVEQESSPDPVPGRSRGQRRADALYALCLQRRSVSAADVAEGDASSTVGPSAPAPAAPAMVVLTDIETLTGAGQAPRVEHTAELLWRASRGPMRLTAGAVERMACRADIRPVLMDGSVPLGVGAPTTNVGAPLRAALVARDGTCRFPSCREAADRCDNHHIVPRHRHGPTVLENLVLLCPAHHRAVHEGGWRATLHPDGTMTFRRRGRELTTVPLGEQRTTPSRPPPRGRPRRSSGSEPPPTRQRPTPVDLPF